MGDFGTQTRRLKTSLAEFEEAIYDGFNPSGFEPIGELVLVKPDSSASRTSGGIEIPDEIAERQTLGSSTGVIVAVGPGAFTWNRDRTRPYDGDPPKPGDRVLFQKFAGEEARGADGAIYRLIEDHTIGARIVPPEAAAPASRVISAA